MLVLSRKIKESITLQTQEGIITIFIKNINGRQVKVGIDAPQSVYVVRSELLAVSSKEHRT
jgi:carbon storage regulator CsrA